MRESRPEILADETGKIYTILLQGGYCGEHEQGIELILHTIGCDTRSIENTQEFPKTYKGPWGIERTKATHPPKKENQIAFAKTKETEKLLPCGAFCLLSIPSQKIVDAVKTPRSGAKAIFNLCNITPRKDTPEHLRLTTTSCWDEYGLVIFTTDPSVIEFLEAFSQDLLEKKGHATIWLGGGGKNPFARPGICLGLLDRIPNIGKETAETHEKNTHQLAWLAEETGIPKLIPREKYYCLKPGKKLKNRVTHGKYPETFETAHEVMFFLNPREQQKNNSGWFTVEELQAWMRSEGPIPIK